MHIIPLTVPPRPNTKKDWFDYLQHHKPKQITPGSQFTHNKHLFINMLKSLQEFALQNQMTQQCSLIQSTHARKIYDNAPSSAIRPWAKDTRSAALSTHSSRRPKIGNHEFS